MAEIAEDFAPISEAYPTHFGSHPKYDLEIQKVIQDVIDDSGTNINNLQNLSDNQLVDLIDEIEYNALDVLESWKPYKLN